MEDPTKTYQDLIEENALLWQKVKALERSESARIETEDALRERVKELNYIYSVSDSIKRTDIFEELLQNIVNQMPQGWYYPKHACARITLENQEFKTGNFQETLWKLSSEVIFQGQPHGIVEVCYLEKMPDRDEGPFLKEERSLINAIADFVGRVIEHRLTEAALRSSEAKFKGIFQTIEDLYFETDPQGNITIVSPSAERLTGWTQEELIGKSDVTVYVNPEDEKGLRNKIIENDYVNDYEILLRKKNGDIWNASASVRRFFDSQGQSTGVRGLLRDITERKRMEEELAESEKKFRAIYEGSNDAIMIFSEDHFLDCNERTLEMFRIPSKEEFCNLHPYELSPPVQPSGQNSWTAVNEREKEAYLQGYNRFEWMHQRADGEIFQADVLLSPFSYGGKIILQATIRDITSRKQIEAERERLISSLQKALSEVKTLSGLLPICASCKKIRDDKGYWNQIESYIQQHSEAEFSHGICPDCLHKLYPDLYPGMKPDEPAA